MGRTSEEERLLVLMAKLTARPDYVTGETPFPEKVTVADACAIAEDIHAAVDMGTEKRAELTARQGHPVACHAGCASCCDQLVFIWAGEAELIASWLAEPDQAAIRESFLAAYPAWRERSAAAIARFEERSSAGDEEGQLEELMAFWRLRVRCAFNRDGLCTIYPVRPTICRNCHALDTPEHCHPSDETGQQPTSMFLQPLEQFIDRTRALSMAVHHALGRRRRVPEALCTAVHERLSKRLLDAKDQPPGKAAVRTGEGEGPVPAKDERVELGDEGS